MEFERAILDIKNNGTKIGSVTEYKLEKYNRLKFKYNNKYYKINVNLKDNELKLINENKPISVYSLKSNGYSAKFLKFKEDN